MRRGLAGAVAALAVLGGVASAAPITIADFGGGEEAQATAILVTSLLAEPGAPPASGGKVAPGAGGDLQRLAAEVTSTEEELRADFRVEEVGGRRLWAARATAAPGDVTALATGIARTVAQRQGLQVGSAPAATLGELRPYARAALALAHGDGRLAAATLLIAEPQVAGRFSGARAIAARVFGDTSLPLAARLRAGRLSGQHRAALALFAASKRQPDAAERAERARLRLASGSPDEVARAAGELRGDPDHDSPSWPWRAPSWRSCKAVPARRRPSARCCARW